jgi:hypothetical protein
VDAGGTFGDPRLATIERAHAVLGLAMLLAAFALGGSKTAVSVGAGWLVLAGTLEIWKRIARRMLSGSPSGAGTFAAGVLGKTLITFGSVILAVRFYEVEVVPFLIGTAGLPVACVIAAVLSPVPQPSNLT